MEEQIPASQPPIQNLYGIEGQITPEKLTEMKSKAREIAFQQAIAQQATLQQPQQKIVYIRRNMTVAEVLLVILLSCGIVTGIQWVWSTASSILPKIEIKIR